MAVIFLVLTCIACIARGADIQLVDNESTMSLFGGGLRKIELKWRNPGPQIVEIPVQVQLIQASAATAVPGAMRPWKTLTILPNQTILESAELDLPTVRAETRFIARWVGPNNQVLGHSILDVYPDDLLNELRVLSGNTAIGVFEPANLLQGLLRRFETVNLRDHPSTGFEGKFAIVTPVEDGAAESEIPFTWVTNLARRGTAVLWIKSAPGSTKPLQPSFYIIRKGPGTIVVAQSSLVSGLADNPKAQLNLVELVRMAMLPERAPLNAENL